MARANRLLAAALAAAPLGALVAAALAAFAAALAAALTACTGPPRGAPAAANTTIANPAGVNTAGAATATAAKAAGQPSDSMPGSARASADASFDWRRLPLAPLGTPYKSLNPLVHEVLLFRDASPQADADVGEESERAEARDCYAPNGAAPRFIGRPTESYLLCFHDDRLKRVQAFVRFDAVEDEPAKLFATLCTDWLAGAEPEVQSAARCAGREGNRAFAAQLAPAEEADAATLGIVVYDVSER